jgi:hypothetical protein
VEQAVAAAFLQLRIRRAGSRRDSARDRLLARRWTFTEEAPAEKHMAQLQHNMWIANARSAVLSIITGGGKWVELTVAADPLYQHLLLTAEKKFWRCVHGSMNLASNTAPPGSTRPSSVAAIHLWTGWWILR